MTTFRFSSTNKIKEIQSKLYLLTNKEFTQQEILEMSISIVSDNIDLILKKIEPGYKNFTQREIEEIKNMSTDWGEGTEDSSESIDNVLYS